MPVGDYCQRSVSTARPEETLRVAARRMEQDGVGSLVVLQGERVVGVLTDRDLVLRGLGEGLDLDSEPIRKLLVREPVTVHADSPLSLAAALMRRGALRRLPVVDRTERLVGIIAVDDLLRLVARELSGLADAVAAQAPTVGGVSAPTNVGGAEGPEAE